MVNKKQKLMIKAIKEKKGSVTSACKVLGITRKTFYDNIKKCPELAQALDDIRLQFNEILEKTALDKAIAGDTTMIIFLLKTRCGYREKIEVENTGVSTVVNLDASKLSDEKLNELLNEKDDDE